VADKILKKPRCCRDTNLSLSLSFLMPLLQLWNTFRWLRWIIFPIFLALIFQRLFLLSNPRWFETKDTNTNDGSTASFKNTPPPSTAFRSRILDYGARVACWPRSGGIWIKHALPLELDFLNLSRENNTRRPWPPITKRKWQAIHSDWPSIENSISEPDLFEEDVFCEKMRMIGAEYWDVPADMNNTGLAYVVEHVKPQISSQLAFAWPDLGEDFYVTQGAWMINLTVARTEYGPGMKGWNNVHSMEERCRVAKEIGALWCPIHEELCQGMWCAQYPDHCHEAERVSLPAEFWWFGRD
jgi:hypothetical protein